MTVSLIDLTESFWALLRTLTFIANSLCMFSNHSEHYSSSFKYDSARKDFTAELLGIIKAHLHLEVYEWQTAKTENNIKQSKLFGLFNFSLLYLKRCS